MYIHVHVLEHWGERTNPSLCHGEGRYNCRSELPAMVKGRSPN